MTSKALFVLWIGLTIGNLVSVWIPQDKIPMERFKTALDRSFFQGVAFLLAWYRFGG
jgi:hypothetical protein